MIVKQINNMVGNLDQVAEGALDVTVGSKLLERGDEIGNIARSIHALTTGLARIIHSILKTSDEMDTFSVQFQDSFEKISESIANVNVAVEEIANGATSQAGETQNVNERMNEMGVAIEETAQQVVSLREAAQTMQEYNNTVGQTIVELSQISDETRRSVNEVHEQTNTTNRSTQEIRTATEIIADIADQTNLLSLNASIEAARAGEMGKGFAVVADEIRVLADQSRDSAEQISKVVDSLIENSNTSVETMLNLVDVIQKQDEKLSDTRQVFESLNSEITEVGDAIANINARIERIGRSKTVAMGGVESLAAIAQQNAASTQETAASMTELDKIVSECSQATQQLVSMASELKGLTTKFKLGDMQDVHNMVEEIKDSAAIVAETELAVE
jgi:methyl-accepting chemotaxis protein